MRTGTFLEIIEQAVGTTREERKGRRESFGLDEFVGLETLAVRISEREVRDLMKKLPSNLRRPTERRLAESREIHDVESEEERIYDTDPFGALRVKPDELPLERLRSGRLS